MRWQFADEFQEALPMELFPHYVAALFQEREQVRLAKPVPIRLPDIMAEDPDYKPTITGKVDATQEFPQTEGYRPTQGYFSQTPACDKIMRVWMRDCTFKDFPDSYYHKGAGKLFPPLAKPKSTANWIGNLMANSKPIIQHYNSPSEESSEDSRDDGIKSSHLYVHPRED